MSNYSIAAVIQKTFIEELPAKNVQAYSISSNILTYDFTGKVRVMRLPRQRKRIKTNGF